MAGATNPALGIDLSREGGADIVGWDHVEQSIIEILSTEFGERTWHEWFGSSTPRFLGKSLSAKLVLRLSASIAAAINQWEPRYLVKRVKPVNLDNNGRVALRIEGVYRPLALLGNFSDADEQNMTIGLGGGTEISIL